MATPSPQVGFGVGYRRRIFDFDFTGLIGIMRRWALKRLDRASLGVDSISYAAGAVSIFRAKNED